jgi:hypothetical protein
MRIARQSSKGTCCFCNGSFAKSAMSRHLGACKRRKEVTEGQAVETPGEILLHLQVDGQYSPMYWLHIEIPAKAKLKALDRFLRDIWLECCGHLSSFEIAGKTFFSERMEPGDRSMNVALAKVIAPDMKFEHIYDFGTSTELLIRVISAREGKAQGKGAVIMARNDPPDFRCNVCGKPATWICCQCSDEDTGYVCDECAKKHECGEDMLLPLVNSPRTGMCGYTGECYD